MWGRRNDHKVVSVRNALQNTSQGALGDTVWVCT